MSQVRIDATEVIGLANQLDQAAKKLIKARADAMNGGALATSAFGATPGGAECGSQWSSLVAEAAGAVANLVNVLVADAAKLKQTSANLTGVDQQRAAGLLNIYSVHTGGRSDQINRVWDTVGQATNPSVVAGDLNVQTDGNRPGASDRDADGRNDGPVADALRRHQDLGYTDTGASAGPTHTDRRIDYVFSSPGTVAGNARAIDGGTSDHRGVAVDISVPGSWW